MPRRDSGDAEIYAATMLSLFKPWRNGMDLKTEQENWSEAFHIHELMISRQQLMDNFNLRYECSDARDDFAAQRKLMANQGKLLGNLPFDDEVCNNIEINTMNRKQMIL